jgi:glutathione S-transferase
MSVKVFGVPGSPFLRAVLVGLEEKAVPYQLVPISGPETKQPEHLARHPFGRVPAFWHDGFSLYETQAILRYLDAAFPGPALRPTDIKALARMDQLIGINDWYLFPQVGVTIAFQRIVKPLLMGGTPDEEIIAKAIPNAERAYAVIAGFLDAAFLTGPELSIADILIACHMNMLAATPECQAIIAKHPALRDWLIRMEARPSLQKTDLMPRKAA